MTTTTRPIIVLDPGHGGWTDVAGSTADHTYAQGLSEKDLTLELARRIRDRLSPAATVLLTRDSDANLSLASRAVFAQIMAADLFVSLHFNGHPDPAHDATEVYVSRQSTDADRELAAELLRTVTSSLGTTSGGILAADLGVVVRPRHAPTTEVALLEVCDLTHPGRASAASRAEFLDNLGGAISDALRRRLAANGRLAPVAGSNGWARAQDVDTDVTQVLERIRAEARSRAAAVRRFSPSDRFVQVLSSRYLDRYLPAPTPNAGQEAIARIAAQNTSGAVTTICGRPDRWEEMTPHLNNVSVPGLQNVPGLGGLLDNVGAATAIISVANRRDLDHIDGPYLLGRHDVDMLDCAARINAALDPDLQGGNDINESQLMHWATGVRYHEWSQERIRDLFLAYELWHLELWDVFGRDPINDLIAEDAGWQLAQGLRTGTVSSANLVTELDRYFGNARAWVGALLAIRRNALDAQITAEVAPTAHIHWTLQDIDASMVDHPYRSPSIRQMLRDGQSVEQVMQTRLAQNYVAVYTLIIEAETNAQHVSGLQRMMAAGDLDWAFRAAGGDAPVTSPLPSTSGLARRLVRAANVDETGPLTDQEWGWVESWQSRGVVGIDQLTADVAANARLVAGAIFCGRHILTPSSPDDPLMCVDPNVTGADPRVQALIPQVTARGPIIDWPDVAMDERRRYVVARLVDVYGYPVNGAAGIVGNLAEESQLIPSRLEGSQVSTPMRSEDFSGVERDWEPNEVRDRNTTTGVGPQLAGVGLAQWTYHTRRSGFFAHAYGSRPAGTGILFDMDAQIDYLVNELGSNFAAVNAIVTNPTVTLNDASDEVIYNFEEPQVVWDETVKPKVKRSRTDPGVQAEFAERRAASQAALNAYSNRP